MNLIQSICCFFSSRCASEAVEPKKADQDGYVKMQAPLRNHLVPQLLKPKIRVGVGLECACVTCASPLRLQRPRPVNRWRPQPRARTSERFAIASR
jgi:hypothetical protein